ncbi:MAG: hypothetical protein HY900_05845 [Deltaproteobacteria bacterium]|nr:hypothetical protein [Deltaproteobacteria bacterium]
MGGGACREAVERYVHTGAYDSQHYAAFRGGDFLARARHAHAALRGALIDEVVRRAGHAIVSEELAGLDLVALTRARVAPMVRGLFPRREQDLVLDALGWSVVFLTPANIEAVLRQTKWHHTAWSLANLYLAGVNVKPLGRETESVADATETASET